ncbi:hypothetical protein V8C86DRAFT_2521393 [Haematococcus lacustris]
MAARGSKLCSSALCWCLLSSTAKVAALSSVATSTTTATRGTVYSGSQLSGHTHSCHRSDTTVMSRHMALSLMPSEVLSYTVVCRLSPIPPSGRVASR